MPFHNANEVLDNFRLSVNAAEVYFSISSKHYLFCFVHGIDCLFIIYTLAERVNSIEQCLCI